MLGCLMQLNLEFNILEQKQTSLFWDEMCSIRLQCQILLQVFHMSLVLYKKHSKESVCGMNAISKEKRKNSLHIFILSIFPIFPPNVFSTMAFIESVSGWLLQDRSYFVSTNCWASLDWSKPSTAECAQILRITTGAAVLGGLESSTVLCLKKIQFAKTYKCLMK